MERDIDITYINLYIVLLSGLVLGFISYYFIKDINDNDFNDNDNL